MSDAPSAALPQPFYTAWPSGQRPAARALWHWHSALVTPAVPSNSSVDSYFDEERARTEAGDPLRVVPEDVWTNAYEACEAHGLESEYLGAQVDAARLLHGTTRFETADRLDTFVRLWAVPHARLLAHLASLTNSVQISWVDELATGFFHLAHLLRLPADLQDDALFVPLDELRKYDVSVEQLRSGPATENVQRLLWTQTVRVRDALQRGRPLAKDLWARQRYPLLRYWHGALAYIEELDRRDFDLWSAPIALSRFRRIEVYLHVLFGRS